MFTWFPPAQSGGRGREGEGGRGCATGPLSDHELRVCMCVWASVPPFPPKEIIGRDGAQTTITKKRLAQTHTHVRAYVHVYICMYIYIYIKAEGARHAAHTHTCARRGGAIGEEALHASRVQCPMLLALRLLSLPPLQTCPRSHYEHVKQDAHTHLQPTSPLLRCGYALALEDRPSGRRVGALHPAGSGEGWAAPGHRPPETPCSAGAPCVSPGRPKPLHPVRWCGGSPR